MNERVENNVVEEQCVENKTKKKKVGVVVSIVLIAVLGVVAAVVVPKIKDVNETIDQVFFVGETETLNLKEKMYIAENCYSSENEEFQKQYAKPAWEYLLDKNKNATNYHTDLRFTVGNASFKFDILKDNDIAKAIMSTTIYDGDEIVLFKDWREFYVVTEDDTVVAYMQNDDGKWVKIINNPLIAYILQINIGDVLSEFDVNKMTVPMLNVGNDVIETSMYVPSKIDHSKIDQYVGTDDRSYNICFDKETHMFSYLEMNGFASFKEFVELKDLGGKNAIIDLICDGPYADLWVPTFIVDQYEEVEVELPEEAVEAEEVDNFGFATEDFIANFNEY